MIIKEDLIITLDSKFFNRLYWRFWWKRTSFLKIVMSLQVV